MRGCIRHIGCAILIVMVAVAAVAAYAIVVPQRGLWADAFKSFFRTLSDQAHLVQSLREPLEPRFNENAAEQTSVTVTAYKEGWLGLWCSEVAKGSGFFLGDRASIVTAWHVAEEAGNTCQMSVTLVNGETISARKWQRSRYADVALIRLLPSGGDERQLRLITPLEVGKSTTLRIGQPVFVLALNQRAILAGRFMGSGPCGEITDGLFFTCPVKPGDSGSPVLNRDGQVVGIVTKSAKVSAALLFGFFQYDGDGGCAVPVEYVR